GGLPAYFFFFGTVCVCGTQSTDRPFRAASATACRSSEYRVSVPSRRYTTKSPALTFGTGLRLPGVRLFVGVRVIPYRPDVVRREDPQLQPIRFHRLGCFVVPCRGDVEACEIEFEISCRDLFGVESAAFGEVRAERRAHPHRKLDGHVSGVELAVSDAGDGFLHRIQKQGVVDVGAWHRHHALIAASRAICDSASA